jgi:hypothetical protein
VFWWFQRSGDYIRCEAGPHPGGGYQLRIIEPDGTERVERFTDPAALAARQNVVEADLIAGGWSGPHGVQR